MLGTKRKLREMSLKMFTSKALKPIYSPLAVMKKETYERRSKYDLPVAPQDEAGLTTTFQTWPRGRFHIRKDPDFPAPLDKNPMPGHRFELHPLNEVNTKG